MATSLNLLWFLSFIIFLSSSVAFDSRNGLERRKANLAPGLTPDPLPRHPSYDIGRYIEFYQFDALAGEWATTYKSWVVNTLIEAMDVMQNAVTVLSDDAATGGPPANPSFRRYFFDADIHRVTNVFRRLLAAIEAPGYEPLRQSCMADVPKLGIFYQDPPEYLQPNPECHIVGVPAYLSYFTNTEGRKQAYIVLCHGDDRKGFFTWYRAITAVSPILNVFGPSIERGCDSFREEPTWSSAQQFLHELMHHDLAYGDTVGGSIEDLEIERPTGEIEDSYGPFASMHLKDWPAETHMVPVHNADNYNSMAIEMYYKNKYFPNSDFQWRDPVDPNEVDGRVGSIACPVLRETAQPPFFPNDQPGSGQNPRRRGRL